MAVNQIQKKYDDNERDYFDIRNARAVNRVDTNNYPREDNFVPERRYIREEKGKDEDRLDELSQSAIKYSRSIIQMRRSPEMTNIKLSVQNIKANPTTAAKKTGVVTGLLEVSTIPYMFQLAFAIIAFLGFISMGAIGDSSFLGTVDTLTFGLGNDLAAGLWLVGTVGAMIFGLIIAALAVIPLKIAGGQPTSGNSFLVLTICTVLHLCPILNIFPIMAIWCLFVLFFTK